MNKDSLVKFLIVGDLHGDVPTLHFKNFDAIICPGDICGDDIRPYVKELMRIKSKNPLDETTIEDLLSEGELEEIDRISLEKGRKVLEHLNSFEKPVFFVPGNWDFSPYLDGLDRSEDIGKFDSILDGLDNVINVEHTSYSFKGITFIGQGSTSAPEPIRESDREWGEMIGDEEILERYHFFSEVIEKLHSLFTTSQSPIVFLSHNVPLNTTLDKINSPHSYAHNEHYGSRIARMFVDEYQPLLCIGGHIHEGYGKEQVGKTLCVNAGFGGDVNTLVTINVSTKKIEKVEFCGKNKENH